MNRATWLTDRRAAIVATYDGGAREYDQHEYPSDTQREWVSRLVERLPVNSLVLDAPCARLLKHLSLQDLSYVHQFDAVLTIDAMENVSPEDWPAVLANLHRALRPGGLLYMTVEELTEAEIEHAFAVLSEQGAPAVRGEVIEGDVAGYHFYPGRQRVLDWFVAQGLEVLQETFKQENGWGYRHFLLRDCA